MVAIDWSICHRPSLEPWLHDSTKTYRSPNRLDGLDPKRHRGGTTLKEIVWPQKVRPPFRLTYSRVWQLPVMCVYSSAGLTCHFQLGGSGVKSPWGGGGGPQSIPNQHPAPPRPLTMKDRVKQQLRTRGSIEIPGTAGPVHIGLRGTAHP
eukprot:scaffold13663_cov20-Tisochrysis_lutea.AAC.3